jgi:uncharacterized protein
MDQAFRWRRWLRILHRDGGYLVFGLTVVYALSGIALNHKDDWNPSYIISRDTFTIRLDLLEDAITPDSLELSFKNAGSIVRYKAHYRQSPAMLRVFFHGGGSAFVDLSDGKTSIEWVKRRPLFFTANQLHYNPGRWWTAISDVFSITLIAVSLSGLFLLRGKHGITRRGGLLVLLGFLIPGIIAFLSL